MGHGGHVPPLLQMAGHGGHREQKNSKQETDQTVYWPSRKRSPKRLIALVEPKRWRATTKMGDVCPLPRSNSFWRHRPLGILAVWGMTPTHQKLGPCYGLWRAKLIGQRLLSYFRRIPVAAVTFVANCLFCLLLTFSWRNGVITSYICSLRAYFCVTFLQGKILSGAKIRLPKWRYTPCLKKRPLLIFWIPH